MWVLYNAAHESARIRSTDGEAWIRVLGFFESKASANVHARALSSCDAGLEVRIAPQHEFRMIMRSAYKDLPEERDMITRNMESAKHAILLEQHAIQRKQAFENARINAATRQMGDVAFSPTEKIKAYKDAVFSAEKSKTEELAPEPEKIGVKRISADLEVRMQKFAVIGVIPDYIHALQSDALVHEWEAEWEAELALTRNRVLRETLGTRSLPTNEYMLKECVTLNHPPKRVNFFGQLDSPMWTRTQTPQENDSEIKAWMACARHQYGVELWKMLGIECPEPDLRLWMESHPPPYINGAEPAVCFLKAGETEQELAEWISKKKGIEDFDVACVAMYEWIKVGCLWNEKIKRTYRNPMVAKLHANKDLQRSEAVKLTGTAKEIIIRN